MTATVRPRRQRPTTRAAPPHDDGGEDALEREQPHDVGQRMAGTTHAEPVDEGVGGDHAARAQREPDGGPAAAARAAGQGAQTATDDQHAHHLGAVQVLVGEHGGAERDEQRAAAAGQRIHLVELTGRERTGEQHVVDHVQRSRGRHVGPGRAVGNLKRRGEQTHGGGGQPAQGERRQPFVDRLEQRVPARVQGRRQQDYGNHGHAGSLRPPIRGADWERRSAGARRGDRGVEIGKRARMLGDMGPADHALRDPPQRCPPSASACQRDGDCGCPASPGA